MMQRAAARRAGLICPASRRLFAIRLLVWGNMSPSTAALDGATRSRTELHLTLVAIARGGSTPPTVGPSAGRDIALRRPQRQAGRFNRAVVEPPSCRGVQTADVKAVLRFWRRTAGGVRRLLSLLSIELIDGWSARFISRFYLRGCHRRASWRPSYTLSAFNKPLSRLVYAQPSPSLRAAILGRLAANCAELHTTIHCISAAGASP